MARQDLAVTQFKSWSSVIEDAVRDLPEDPRCPADLYLSLLELNMSRDGLTAVVACQDSPVAVIGLQREGRVRWYNIMNWLIPGFVCATAGRGDILPAFAAVRKEVLVGWWRMSTPPSIVHPRSNRQVVSTIPVHRVTVADAESHWRQSSTWRSIRRSRRRCADLDIALDEPGDAQWIIRSAAEKWQGADAVDDVSTLLKVEVARWTQAHGRTRTITIRAAGGPLAGQVCDVSSDDLVMTHNYRDGHTSSLPTGVVVMHEAFVLAGDLAKVMVDIGVEDDYKRGWAPVDGSLSRIVFSSRKAQIVHEWAAVVGRMQAPARALRNRIGRPR